MDEALFEEAKRAYQAGDFRAAAKGFLAAAGEDVASSGAALHMAGNALMRLKRHADAATAYEHALEDPAYDRVGAVCTNLGAAYRAAGRYDEAVEAYDHALGIDEYESPHKAHQGKAGALYEMGKLGEAAASYRDAALESANPDPGRALNNLGLCYMALGRTRDAVEAYRASVSMDGYAGRGRASANLGLALSVLGRHEEALSAFRAAVDDHGFELTGGLLEAHRTSTDTVAAKVAGVEPPAEEEASGQDAFEGVEEPDSDFFTRTDADMRALHKETRREERRAKRKGGDLWLRLTAAGAIAALVFALVAWAWASGLGWPGQKATITALMDAYGDGQEYVAQWVGGATPAEIEQEMQTVPPNYVSYEVGEIDADSTTARVRVDVELDSGAVLTYEFSLAREGVGWKVNGVENDWRSTGQGS